MFLPKNPRSGSSTTADFRKFKFLSAKKYSLPQVNVFLFRNFTLIFVQYNNLNLSFLIVAVHDTSHMNSAQILQKINYLCKCVCILNSIREIALIKMHLFEFKRKCFHTNVQSAIISKCVTHIRPDGQVLLLQSLKILYIKNL